MASGGDEVFLRSAQRCGSSLPALPPRAALRLALFCSLISVMCSLPPGFAVVTIQRFDIYSASFGQEGTGLEQMWDNHGQSLDLPLHPVWCRSFSEPLGPGNQLDLGCPGRILGFHPWEKPWVCSGTERREDLCAFYSVLFKEKPSVVGPTVGGRGKWGVFWVSLFCFSTEPKGGIKLPTDKVVPQNKD